MGGGRKSDTLIIGHYQRKQLANYNRLRILRTAVQKQMANFAQRAASLINRTELIINSRPHRIVEVEFYLYSNDHSDPFCHQNAQQLSNDQWYFHRAGKNITSSYKGGTYKGLDITFGGKGAYGGILIRSIQDLSQGAIVEGPCKVVDHILEVCSIATIDRLVDRISLDVGVADLLYLVSSDRLPAIPLFSGPRVGLTLKGSDRPALFLVPSPVGLSLVTYASEREVYIFRSYRFGIEGLKKEGWGLLLANPARRATCRYFSDYEQGRRMSELGSHRNLKTVSDKCRAYGFLTARYPTG